MWTLRQRRVVLTLLIAASGWLWLQSFRHPVRVPDPQPRIGSRAAELQTRIDPNTADAAALAAIPTLGEKRAQAIVDFREENLKLFPNELPFQQPRDLLKVKGIGVSMVNNLEPYLIFPQPTPSTQPAE